MLAKTHLRIGQLCFLDSPPPDDAIHLRRAFQLAQGQPKVLLDIGNTEFGAERRDRAYAAWKRCLAVTDRYDAQVLSFSKKSLSPEGLIVKLLPASPLRILSFVRSAYSQPDADVAARDALLKHVLELADSTEIADSERLYVQAAAAAMQGNSATAIEQYKEAVFQRPNEIRWRFELAQLLAVNGDLEEAEREARWCLRARPRTREYREFLENLHNSSRIRQGRYNHQQGLQTAH
jgi:tetratricopeptide (TPR) repeat protein